MSKITVVRLEICHVGVGLGRRKKKHCLLSALALHCDACVFSAPQSPLSCAPFPQLNFATPFAAGSPLLIPTSYKRKTACKAKPISIRCEHRTQEQEGNSLDVWLGRLAMVGFALAITVEIATGKGLLENFGVTTPRPTVALAQHWRLS